MRRLATIFLSSVALGQTAPQSQIAIAAKSPLTLARYIESHQNLDWDALWKAIDIRDKRVAGPPCGSATDNPCTTSILTVLNPDQAILIVQSAGRKTNDIYLRYRQEAKGGWRFAGERSAFINEAARRYEVFRIGRKPFLKISSDFSEIGGGFTQEVEEWFDLSQPDFESVFSFTVDGGENRFSFGISRSINAQTIVSQMPGSETIELVVNVHFDGPGLDVPATYLGVYERSASQKKFQLTGAYEGPDRRAAISTKDFEALGDPFEGPSNEQLLVYALPGLQKIATGSDSKAKTWLSSILGKAQDTPEKLALQELLAKP